VHARAELAFPRGSGWWFLVQVRDPEWGVKLQAAVRWVCDTGWGADRSIGRGAAEAEFADDPPGLSIAAEATRRLLLSAYHPTEPERAFLASAAGSAYGLEYVEGRPGTAGPLLMVREGAVLPTPAGTDVAGSCPTVSPAGAPVRLRCCGFAYGIPYGGVG
jgi:CRISPR type III-A-associated RAMP protein Csm4